MRFLFWRLERASSPHTKQTRVRIEMQQNPDAYCFKWSVADRDPRRLSKQELHQLEMRVDKYVATLNDVAPKKTERKTVFATL